MRLPQGQIITLANQKGGCGKSTSAVNLAAGLAREGYTACLVDLDPQCNATTTFGVDPEELHEKGRPTILDAYLKSAPATAIEVGFEERFEGRLTLIPGHRSLDQAEASLEAKLKSRSVEEGLSPLEEDDIRNDHRSRLKRSLATLLDQRDFIIIDTPPRLGFELTTALLAAHWYVIPVFASRYDTDGLTRLTHTVKKIRLRANPKLELLGVVLGNFDPSTTLHKQIRETLRVRFEKHFCDTAVHRSIKHAEATFAKQTIFEHAPGHQAATQFEELTREIIARVELSLHGEPTEPRSESDPGSESEALQFAVGEGSRGH